MKKLFYFSFCLLFGVSCKQADITPQTETSKNKVSITFGNIKHGDWIQIDDLPQLPHLLDTMRIRFFDDGSAFFRSSYPQLFPMEYLEDYLWISQRWGIGAIFDKWSPSPEVVTGMPAYSLYYHLVHVRRNSRFYERAFNDDSSKIIYKVTFKAFAERAYFELYRNERMLIDNFKELSTIIIERLDGKPVKIQTSEGYDAKIEYQ
jgi:hypothetical protein